MTRGLRIAVALALAAGVRGEIASTTQSVSAAIMPVAKLSAPASVALVTSGTTFVTFSGTLAINYRARSTPSGGGVITMQVTSDFSPAGGPSAAAGGLHNICGSASLGTSCTGVQTAGTAAQTPVLTIPSSACTGGGGACSASDPNQVQVIFSLDNDPRYETGSYSALITLVISST